MYCGGGRQRHKIGISNVPSSKLQSSCAVLLVQKQCKRCSAAEVPFYSPHPFISIAGFSAAAESMKAKVDRALRAPELDSNRDKVQTVTFFTTVCVSDVTQQVTRS